MPKTRRDSSPEYCASDDSYGNTLIQVGSPTLVTVGPAPISLADVKFTGDSRDGFPSRVAFHQQMQEYLANLNERKRDKALMCQDMYDNIMRVLLDPKNTEIGTAQFRFWAKKMFKLVNIKGVWLITHENHPVAVKEQIYDVLVHAHHTSGHGGRDKTSAQVRVWYSWIPKELIARFVKTCPLCTARRTNNKVYFAEADDGLYPYDKADIEKFSPTTRRSNAIAAEGMTMRFLEAHGLVTEHADQKTEEQRMRLAAHQAQQVFGMYEGDVGVSPPAWDDQFLQAPAQLHSAAPSPYDATFGQQQQLPPMSYETGYDSIHHFAPPVLPELKPPSEGANLLKKRKAKQPTKFRKISRHTTNDIAIDEIPQLSIETGNVLGREAPPMMPLPDFDFDFSAATSYAMGPRSATDGVLHSARAHDMQFEHLFAQEMARAHSMPLSAPPTMQHFPLSQHHDHHSSSHHGHTYLSVNTNVGYGHPGFHPEGSLTPISPMPATPLSAGFHATFDNFGFAPWSTDELEASLATTAATASSNEVVTPVDSASQASVKSEVNMFEAWTTAADDSMSQFLSSIASQ